MRCIDYTEQRWISSELGNSRSEWNRWDVHPNNIHRNIVHAILKNFLVRGLNYLSHLNLVACLLFDTATYRNKHVRNTSFRQKVDIPIEGSHALNDARMQTVCPYSFSTCRYRPLYVVP